MSFLSSKRQSMPLISISRETLGPLPALSSSAAPRQRLRSTDISSDDTDAERRELEHQLRKVVGRCAQYEQRIAGYEENIDQCLARWADRLRQLRQCDAKAEVRSETYHRDILRVELAPQELDRRVGLSRTRLTADVTTAVQQAREALIEGEGRLAGGLGKLETAVEAVGKLRKELAGLEKQLLAQEAERKEQQRMRNNNLYFTMSIAVAFISIVVSVIYLYWWRHA